MDMGLEKLRNMVLDMAELSQNTVSTSIDAYVQGRDLRDRIYSWSEELRMLQDEVSELAVELIARYQPVASDLRFIKSCMEVSYGFSRFGRYAHDISDVLDIVKKSAQVPEGNLKCFVSGTLILRYLERIADHATYVGETVLYIVSGERAARK